MMTLDEALSRARKMTEESIQGWQDRAEIDLHDQGLPDVVVKRILDENGLLFQAWLNNVVMVELERGLRNLDVPSTKAH